MAVKVVDRRGTDGPGAVLESRARAWQVLDAQGHEVASPAIARRHAQRQMLSAYRGASTGRTLGDWGAHPGAADDTLLPERLSLIWRIDERLRNDPVMKGCLNRVVDSVVGPRGFHVQSQIDHERLGLSEEQGRDIELAIDQVWDEWQENCDYAGNPARNFNFPTLLGLNYSTRLTRGETLTIPRYVRRRWSRFSFCIQCVTPERIVHPDGFLAGFTTSSKLEDIRDGIKIGRRGEVEGVYVAKRHPYSFIYSPDLGGTDYLPAVNRKNGRANFWHRFFPYRMEATRGEPAFAACLAGFKAVGDYFNEELTRARLAAMFGLAVFREEPFDPDTEGLATADKVGSTAEQAHAQVDWIAGQLNYLEPGDKVETVNPNLPGPQFREFSESLMTCSASPLPLSREQLLNNFNGLSWSSGKISRDEAERGQEREQDDVMVDYIAPCRERVIEEAWLRGYIDLPGFERPELRRLFFGYQYFAPKRPYLQPVEEAKGAAQRLENGTTSLKLECARGGHSLRSILMDRKREIEELKRIGLPLPPGYREDPPPGPGRPPADTGSGPRNEASGDDASD